MDISQHIGGEVTGGSRYIDNYYSERLGNDPKRQEMFHQEAAYLKSFIRQGRLMDVGCSTGEFVEVLQWDGSCYGMEVSEFAISEARKRGMLFDHTVFDVDDFFDVVVFRGTIQHIDTPFLYIKRCFAALRPGGYVFFLATPNANSIYYKLWNTFPFLSDSIDLEFYIPSDVTLRNALTNFGFQVVDVRFPYIETPYASPLRDHCRFLFKLLGFNTKFPFWRNIMMMAARKPIQEHGSIERRGHHDRLSPVL